VRIREIRRQFSSTTTTPTFLRYLINNVFGYNNVHTYLNLNLNNLSTYLVLLGKYTIICILISNYYIRLLDGKTKILIITYREQRKNTVFVITQ